MIEWRNRQPSVIAVAVAELALHLRADPLPLPGTTRTARMGAIVTDHVLALRRDVSEELGKELEWIEGVGARGGPVGLV